MLKRLVNFRIKYRIRLFFQKFKPLNYFKGMQLSEDKNYAFIFLAADYGNLGDVAITYAQTKFLRENLKADFEVIEIPISQSLEGLHFVKQNIKPGDIVTSVGGGNLGDIYDQIEFIRQLAVSFFPKNRFISFPQTFDFRESARGQKALKVAKEVYNKHPDLYFIAREKTSYGLMKKHFYEANVMLTPDIVISLNKEHPKKTREGAVICMRSDKEKNLTTEQSKFVLDSVKERFDEVSFYDTHINRNKLSVKERELELNRIWDAFKGAELVVTDRLHGMIFCYITNTPCLVFQNNNHKVRETYDWISNNENINLVDSFSEDAIVKFLKQSNFDVGVISDLSHKYQPIKEVL